MGKSTMEVWSLLVYQKSHMTYNQKQRNSLERVHMEQLNLITNFLELKQKYHITDEYDMGTHLELHGHLDYTAPKCPKCKGQIAKYNYQKTSKIPYLEISGYLSYPSSKASVQV